MDGVMMRGEHVWAVAVRRDDGGIEIRVEDAEGTSHTNAIFFIDKRLYQIRVDYPAKNSDPAGSSGIHFFQQAFRLLP